MLLIYGVHRPLGLWYCIRNIQHTKLWGSMCDTVKILSPLFSPFTHLILLWTIHPCIISNLLLKLINYLIYFNYVSSRIPCIGQWCFCCISHNSSLNGYGDSNIHFVRIYIYIYIYMYVCMYIYIYMILSHVHKIIFMCGWSVKASHITLKGDPH